MAKYLKSKGPERRKAKRKLRRYLIVSEDSKSSLDYLRSFSFNPKLVEIDTEGGAGNTVGVVERGIERVEAARKEGTPFIHTYCVFDKDDWSLNRYEAAFSKAKQHNDLTAIWANECFELWYLLHFEYRNTSIGRHDLCKQLEKRLGTKYSKTDKTIYESLQDKQQQAIANARRLYHEACQEGAKFPWRINPSTNVHVLVQKLNELGESINDVKGGDPF